LQVLAIDDAFFHDEEYFLGLPDVLRRVAGYGDDIGQFPNFQRADALLRPE